MRLMRVMSLMRHGVISSGVFRETPKTGPQALANTELCAP